MDISTIRLISKLNNASFLKNNDFIQADASRSNILLCKNLYEEGVITSFEVLNDKIKIILNVFIKRKKLIKPVFQKKRKLELKIKEIFKIKSSNKNLFLCGNLGLKNLQYYKLKKIGGIPMYFI